MLPGYMVPDYEEYAAMLAANYNEPTWKATDYRLKARAVAFYRYTRLLNLHVEEARADAEIEFSRNRD